MKNQNDIVFITNLPSFYKINLFNGIAKEKKILVIFTHVQSEIRNDDFYIGKREFPYISLADKSLLGKMNFLLKLFITLNYKYIIVGGWDHLIYWITVFTSKRKRNGVLVESSIFESEVKGIKGLIKKIFLSRISKTYVSGKSLADLCLKLGFKEQIIKTKGVGIFNIRPQQKYSFKSRVENFIFVGRLSPEKNIQYLIEIFNQFPELRLNIVGYGPEESFLKSIAGKNVIFHGAIPNVDLYKLYLINDVFILPSISEPWGMVVEEALNCGLPVIVSNKTGCAEEIVNETNGLVFNLSETDALKYAIIKILDIDYYNSLRLNISKLDFTKIAHDQINCYL